MWAKFSLYLEMILKLAAPSPNLFEIIRLNNNRLSFRHHKKIFILHFKSVTIVNPGLVFCNRDIQYKYTINTKFYMYQ